MKFKSLLPLIPSFFALCSAQVFTSVSEVYSVSSNDNVLEPMSESFSLLYDQIMESYHTEDAAKRDLLDSLTGLLGALNQSGVIIQVLHEIADSPEQMNTLSNYIFQALVSALTSTAMSGLNITVNITEILEEVKASGILEETVAGLLLDENQRNILADNLGEILVNNTWIPKLMYTLGDTGKISWETIFDLARNTVSKDPGFNGTSYTYKYQTLHKRDASNDSSEYSGSLLSFINNIVGSAISSDVFGESIGSVLTGIQNSGVVIPTIQASLADGKIQKMIGFIANKLYNYGVFDQIPLNDMLQKLKREGTLAKQTQALFQDDTWSYVIGNVFLRFEQRGVNNQIRANLYGP